MFYRKRIGLLKSIRKKFDNTISIKWYVLRCRSCYWSWHEGNVLLVVEIREYLIIVIDFFDCFFLWTQHEFDVHPTCINVIHSLSKVYLLEDDLKQQNEEYIIKENSKKVVIFN